MLFLLEGKFRCKIFDNLTEWVAHPKRDLVTPCSLSFIHIRTCVLKLIAEMWLRLIACTYSILERAGFPLSNSTRDSASGIRESNFSRLLYHGKLIELFFQHNNWTQDVFRGILSCTETFSLNLNVEMLTYWIVFGLREGDLGYSDTVKGEEYWFSPTPVNNKSYCIRCARNFHTDTYGVNKWS